MRYPESGRRRGEYINNFRVKTLSITKHHESKLTILENCELLDDKSNWRLDTFLVVVVTYYYNRETIL